MRTAATLLVFVSLGLMFGGAVTIGILVLLDALALIVLEETFDA